TRPRDQRGQLDAVLEAGAMKVGERQTAPPEALHAGVEVRCPLAEKHVEESRCPPVSETAQERHGRRVYAQESRSEHDRVRLECLEDRRDDLRGVFEVRVDHDDVLGFRRRDAVANRRTVALVAAMPDAGFHQLYGPSVFFVNGALLKLFGADLRAIRLSLVALKAVVVVFVYLLTRRVASRPVALVLYGLLVAIWGMPIWLFNTPYATYYATALSLAGLLLASAERARWIASGVCMGLAMTFKQTQGIFAFLAIVLFVIVMTPPRAGPATHAARARQWAGGVRILALGGTLAFAVAYVAPHLATVSAILMLAPLA